MAGNVYVFNLYVAAVTQFSTNGQASAGTIAAPASSTAAPYTPAQLVVPRTQYPANTLTSTMFAQGKNTMTVDFNTGQSFSGTVVIPDVPALNFDLWLYIAVATDVTPGTLNGIALLFDTTGMMIPQSGPGGTLTLEISGGSAATDRDNKPPLA
jgi:hypothetical protein